MLLSLLCTFLLVASPLRFARCDSTGSFDLATVMGKLAEVRSAEGRFTERKYLSILSEPLVMEGRVRYRAPDHVRKEYDNAVTESYEIRGDHLVIEYPDGRRREMSIDEHPVLRAFVESYRGTLAGDLESLRKYFELELDGHMDDWILRLIPRNPDLAAYLSEVVMLGRGTFVYSVETLETSGDRSVMTVYAEGE